MDIAPRDAATTNWKRSARLHQAIWRESNGFPIGHHPYSGGPVSTPVGSRLDLAYAIASGANFLTPKIRAAVEHRLAHPEKHQMLREARLWADLLSSMPMCFNLFGECHDDAAAADRLVHALWPDAPLGASSVRFEYSPCRLSPEFLGNRSAFDAAIQVEMADGGTAIIGIETKYHEHCTRERRPSPSRMDCYMEVTEKSGVFVENWRDLLIGTEIQQIWLDHLLVLSMLQHPSTRWRRGKFLLVHPRANLSYERAANAYRVALRDSSTFESHTVESILERGVLEPAHEAAFRERYLF